MASTNHPRNGLKNGTRISRLTLGTLPKPMVRIQQRSCAYRRDLESAVLEVHGTVDVVHAHHVDAAVACETHAQVCRWLLRHRLDKMTIADVLACSGQIAKCKADRNRSIMALGLDVHRDAWDVVHVDTGDKPA